MANHIALRRIEADADSEPHQPDTIHATNRSNTMQAARLIKTIFFILASVQVSPPSHSASEQVTKSKGRTGGDLAQQSFELSEHLLDRIEVGRIRRQIEQLGAGSPSIVNMTTGMLVVARFAARVPMVPEMAISLKMLERAARSRHCSTPENWSSNFAIH
jgi:hypothetical protein